MFKSFLFRLQTSSLEKNIVISQGMGSKAEWSGVEQNGVTEWSEFCNKPENFFKLHLAYLHNFFYEREH